jgi:hypothetical protein
VPVAGAPLRAVGRRLERRVRQRHRVIGEKRLRLVLLHEPRQERHEDVFAVFTFDLPQLAVLHHNGIGIARAFVFGVPGVPDAVLVEAAVLRQHSPAAPFRLVVGRVVAVKLPFPCDARLISGGAHQMGECLLFRIEDAESSIIPEVVLAGHELQPGGRAERLGIRIREANAADGEGVKPRRPVRRASVTGETLVAQIVGHDEHDIGPCGGLSGRCRCRKKE